MPLALPARARIVVGLLALLSSVAAGGEIPRFDLRFPAPTSSKAAYAALAERCGRRLVVDPAVRPKRLRVDLEHFTCDEALDQLTSAAGEFWMSTRDGALLIAPDTPTKRRNLQTPIARWFDVERADPGEVATALRTLLGMQRLEVEPHRLRAVDTESRLGYAAQVLARLDAAVPCERSTRWLASEAGVPVGAPDPRETDDQEHRVWFPEPTPWQRLRREVERLWDVQILLDPSVLSPGTQVVTLERASLSEALDALTLPLGRFWTFSGGRRIQVAPDTPQNRRRLEPTGLACFEVTRSKPRHLLRSLRELRIAPFALGSGASTVLVARGNPLQLAETGFVVDRLEEAATANEAPPARILWSGWRTWPRHAEAQRILDPKAELASRRDFELRRPPTLTSRQRSARADSPPLPIVDTLRRDWGLNAIWAPCGRGNRDLRKVLIPTAGASPRNVEVTIETLADNHGFLWTALGPETVLLGRDEGACRELLRPRGLAAIPVGPRPNEALERASALGLTTPVIVPGKNPTLLIRGPLAALEQLVGELAPP